MSDRRQLACPFEQRSEAKELGAKWDPDARCWYADTEEDWNALVRWHPKKSSGSSVPGERHYIHATYDDRDEVKALGAVWDKTKKKWYASSESTYETLKRWHAPRASRMYFESTYNERDEIKALGARWDADAKRWYAPTDKERIALETWRTNKKSPSTTTSKRKRCGSTDSEDNFGFVGHLFERDI